MVEYYRDQLKVKKIWLSCVGRADETYTKKHNQTLSEKRAFAVAMHIYNKMGYNENFFATFMGPNGPVSTGKRFAGKNRPKDRRVDIFEAFKKPSPSVISKKHKDALIREYLIKKYNLDSTGKQVLEIVLKFLGDVNDYLGVLEAVGLIGGATSNVLGIVGLPLGLITTWVKLENVTNYGIKYYSFLAIGYITTAWAYGDTYPHHVENGVGENRET